MDLRWLEDAVVLLEEKSLSQAAARRNITQPAFSRRIKALEHWAGSELLTRHANRVSLHPALVENETEIRALLQRLERLKQRIAGHHPGRETRVIVSQHALTASVFPAVYRTFDALRPNITWRLRTLNREDCVAMFLRADADMLLCYEAPDFPPLPFDDTIARKIWRRDTLIPLVGGHLRHTLDANRQLAEGTPLVVYPTDSHFGRLIQRAGVSAELGQPAQAVRVESAFTVGVSELVRAGIGAGWVPHSMVQSHLASGDMVSLAEQYGTVALEISLFCSQDNLSAASLLSSL